MKTNKKLSVVFALFFILTLTGLVLASEAKAITAPTLTLTSVSDGDSVELKATGLAGASVIFYYTKVGSGLQINYLGKTDSNGNFSTNLSTASYGLSGNAIVYVTVNGTKSNEAAWPYQAAASVLSLSQTSVVLTLSGSIELTAYNNGTNYIYLSSNSNPPVVNVNIDGNRIILKAFSFGSSVVNICAGASTPSCASVYVTVQNTGGKALAFSQNNPTVAPGQNVAVSIIGGTGTYTILNNSSANTIQTSLSGSTITLSTLSTSGSSAITVCSSDISSCGIINAVVGNASTVGLNFSLTNPTMAIGQSLNITVSGGTGGNYTIFSNSNTDAVSASISDNLLVLTARNGGVATVTVCSSMGNCAGEVVTVNYNSQSGGSIALSQNNLWLLSGQVASITVSGGTMPYSASGFSENYIKASFNNNVLTVTGVNAGSVSVNICSSAGGCAILSVLVTGTNANTNANVSATPLSLSQTSLALSAGNTGKILISGNGGYSISSNPNPAVASVRINGSTAIVDAINIGNTSLVICQNDGQCKTVTVTVSAAVKAVEETPAGTNGDWIFCADEKKLCSFTGYQTVRYGASGKYFYASQLNGVACTNSIFGDPIENVVKQCYYGGVIPSDTVADVAGEKITVKFKFSKTLIYGASGNEVKELQTRLKAEGFYSGAVDGKYLTSVVTAVKKYQKAKGISQTGNMGPLTMAALNK
jgi:hypothetical protein